MTRSVLSSLARIAAAAALAAAPASPAAPVARQSLDFRITIPALLRVQVVGAAPVLRVPPGPAAPQAEESMVLRIQNNCRDGVYLAASLADDDVRRAHLEVDGRAVLVERAGAVLGIPFWGTRAREFRVTYRLELEPGARPGTRAWPVVLAVSNCA